MKKTISIIFIAAITFLIFIYLSSIENKLIDKKTLNGSFSLIDVNGNPVSDKDFKNDYKLVFFGFTHCPMVCPTGLTTMSNVIEDISKLTKTPIAYFFITVDPERDTPEVLKKHLADFNPKIHGLTGTPKQIAEVQKHFKAFSKKGSKDENGDYMVDHSSYIYFMNPNNEYAAHFSYDINPEKIIKKIMGVVQKK